MLVCMSVNFFTEVSSVAPILDDDAAQLLHQESANQQSVADLTSDEARIR